MSIENLHHFVVPAEFACTIISDSIILSNIYSIKLAIDPITDNPEDITIGIQRIKHIINNFLQNSVLIHKDHPLAKEMAIIDNNVVYLPDDPYDLYVGSVLFAKFIAVTEKYFEIEYLQVASLIGDSIQYTIGSPFDCGLELEGDHWWNSDTVSTGHKTVITWDELNLTPAPKFQPTVVQGGLSGDK